MRKKILTGSGLLMALVLFLAVNMFSNAAFTSARLDLTENRLYTLSDGTRNILENLDEPITLRLYLSQKLVPLLPGINSYTIRVRELLEEFDDTAGRTIALEIIEPEPFSEEEDRAVGYGLRGVPIGQGDTVFYFGLVGTSSTDEEQAILFFQPDREEFLEYELAKLVHQLAHPKRRVVGLLSSLPLEGGMASPLGGAPRQTPPWMILDQMRHLFEVRTLAADTNRIPEEVAVLMLVHPKDLADTTLYAIDQFVLNGGRALVFVDPHAEADQMGAAAFNRMAPRQRNSDLGKLFEAWGVTLVPGKVVGDLPFARRVQYRQQARVLSANYPVWIDLPADRFNRDHVVTAQLSNLTMATPGALQIREGATTEVVPLVQSGDQAMQIDVARVQFVTDIAGLVRDYTPGGETLILAAHISGNVKTAFPNGKPAGQSEARDARAADASEPAHVAESPEPINVIVVADTDLLQDYFWVQVQNFLGQRVGIPTAGNGSFVINALENLSGSNDLISIRTRSGSKRPFTLVRALEQGAEQRLRQKEQQLLERKRATERKIQDLQAKKDERSALILSPEQEQEIASFRDELIVVRKELRDVQHNLRRSIESLEGWLKFVNIGFIPLVIGLAGLVIGVNQGRSKREPKSKTGTG